MSHDLPSELTRVRRNNERRTRSHLPLSQHHMPSWPPEGDSHGIDFLLYSDTAHLHLQEEINDEGKSMAGNLSDSWMVTGSQILWLLLWLEIDYYY